MRVLWGEGALNDLAEIVEYIGQDNPDAAAETAERILTVVGQLADAPALGRPGRVPKTRELIVAGTPYLVPYRVKRGDVQILRVFHTAQRTPLRWEGRPSRKR